MQWQRGELIQIWTHTHTAGKSEDTDKHEIIIQNHSSLGPFCPGSYDLMASFD